LHAAATLQQTGSDMGHSCKKGRRKAKQMGTHSHCFLRKETGQKSQGRKTKERKRRTRNGKHDQPMPMILEDSALQVTFYLCNILSVYYLNC
jgi:hypothetical protein